MSRGPPTAIEVEVKSCRDLYRKASLFKMNPFVEVILGSGSKKQKTGICSKGDKFPDWDEKLTFTYDDEPSVTFRVIDKDMIGSDFIGVHTLGLEPIVDGSREFEGTLQLSRHKGAAAGYVVVGIKFHGERGAEPTPLTAAEAEKTATSSPRKPSKAAIAPAPVAPYQPAGAAPAAAPAPAPVAAPVAPAAPPAQVSVQINSAPAAAPQGYAPYGYPPAAPPPYGYPPQGYPPQAYPPQGYPPQQYPPHGYYPPQGGYYPPYGR